MGLEQLANVMPLPQRLEFLTCTYINRSIFNETHPLTALMSDWLSAPGPKPKLAQLCQEKMASTPCLSTHTHPMFVCQFEALTLQPSVHFLPVNKASTNANEVAQQFAKFTRGYWHSFCKIYTDGSKTSMRCGYGVYFSDLELEVHQDIHHLSSIFTAEAEAIVEALKLAGLQDNKRVLIVSDSRSVLEATKIHPSSNTHPTIFSIRSLIHELRTQGFYICLLWVPSHLGIDGNERADLIAADFGTPTSQQHNMLPRDLRPHDRASQIQSWQNNWNTSSMGRALFQISPKVNTGPWFKGLNLPRDVIVSINRLKSSHTKLRDHLKRLDMVSDDQCPCGEAAQTLYHLLFYCNNIPQTHRSKLFWTIRAQGILPLNIDTILGSDNRKIFLALHHFFKSCNINL